MAYMEQSMNVETLVTDVKDRVEPIVAKSQDVVIAGFETLKTANGIVVEGVQILVQTQVEAGKDLFGLAQASFEKARTDGLMAVAQNPIAYLPEGRERVLSAYSDSLTVVSKTGDELVKTFKDGYETISAKLNGAPAAAKRKATRTVKKAGARARKTGRAAATA